MSISESMGKRLVSLLGSEVVVLHSGLMKDRSKVEVHGYVAAVDPQIGITIKPLDELDPEGDTWESWGGVDHYLMCFDYKIDTDNSTVADADKSLERCIINIERHLETGIPITSLKTLSDEVDLDTGHGGCPFGG